MTTVGPKTPAGCHTITTSAALHAGLAIAGTNNRRVRMTVDVDLVIVAIVALTVLLLAAGAEARWRRRGRNVRADARRPTPGTALVTAVRHQARCHPVGRQVSVA